jgi:hypothetical protein
MMIHECCNELERMCKETVVAWFKTPSRICFKELTETAINVIQVSWSSGRDLNPGSAIKPSRSANQEWPPSVVSRRRVNQGRYLNTYKLAALSVIILLIISAFCSHICWMLRLYRYYYFISSLIIVFSENSPLVGLVRYNNNNSYFSGIYN